MKFGHAVTVARRQLMPCLAPTEMPQEFLMLFVGVVGDPVASEIYSESLKVRDLLG